MINERISLYDVQVKNFLWNNFNIRFDYSSKEIFDLNLLKDATKKLKDGYEKDVVKLKKVYHPKIDSVEDVSSILSLSERAKVSYISTRMFLSYISSSVSSEGQKEHPNNLKDIRNKRLKFFLNL